MEFCEDCAKRNECNQVFGPCCYNYMGYVYTKKLKENRIKQLQEKIKENHIKKSMEQSKL